MTSSSRHILFSLICLLILTLNINAQRRRKPAFWEGTTVGPRAGINLFYGDLVDQSRTSYTFGGIAEKEISKYISARLQLNMGQMKGQQIDFKSQEIYAYFKNFYTELSIGASFRPLNLMLGYYKQRSFNPYVIGQFGIVQYSTKEWYGPGSNETPDELWRQFSQISPIVTGGAGLSYWVNSRISANIEFTGTLPFTDLLDGHQEWADNFGNITQTDANDFYYTAMVGITFLIDDSKWKNEPKYNRKAYLKTRNQYSRSGSSKKNQKAIKRKRRKR